MNLLNMFISYLNVYLFIFSCIDNWFRINRTCPEHPGDWIWILTSILSRFEFIPSFSFLFQPTLSSCFFLVYCAFKNAPIITVQFSFVRCSRKPSVYTLFHVNARTNAFRPCVNMSFLFFVCSFDVYSEKPIRTSTSLSCLFFYH